MKRKGGMIIPAGGGGMLQTLLTTSVIFLAALEGCTPSTSTVALRLTATPTPAATTAGYAPRILSAIVEPGAECENGGVRVETWNSPNPDSKTFDASTDRDHVSHVVCTLKGEAGIGTTGPKGDTGASGISIGFAAATVAHGDSDCPMGGQRYDTWRDINSNGTYESATDQGFVSKKICHGLDGSASSAGANAVIVTSALPTGNANCPNGGVQIESFTDMNGDGNFTAGTDLNHATRWVCNGASAVVLTSTIPADGTDTTCRNGGTQYRTFTDVNGNGTFDEAIDTNKVDTKVCHGLKAITKSSAVALNDVTCPAGGTLYETCTDANNDGVCTNGTDTSYSAQKICQGGGAGLVVSAETAGTHCRNGGLKVTRFSDLNGNGALDAGAETATATDSYSCHGLNWLSKSTAFAAGAGTGGDNAACPTGGYRLEFGYDNVKASDGSYDGTGTPGVLDAAEVVAASTAYSCNGARALVSASALSGNDTCPAGGVTVTSCTDTNSNGACDAGENPASSPLCNAPVLLVLTSPEGAGANCTFGGTKLEFGYDHVCAVASGACASMGNYYAGTSGTLDALEVQPPLTRYACKGDQGAGVVASETAEAPGANCTAGGKKVEFYSDPNNNGIRDAGENTLQGTAQYVCNGLGMGYAIAAEPVGPNCLAGGQKLTTWQDRNGNDTYEAGTDGAATTQYACNGNGGSGEPQAGPYIAQFQNDSEGANARFYWQVTSTLGTAAPTVKLAYSANRGSLESWACESQASAPANVTVVENYTACDATYAAATIPFSTATTGALGAQGKCGISLAALAKWEARYFKLCAQETATPSNYSLSSFRVAGYVPPGMVMVHKDDWPLAEFAGSNVQPFTYAIDKYEGYNSNAGSIDNTNACTSTSCAANTSTLVVGSASGQVPVVSIDWFAFKKGCANRAAAGFTGAGHAKYLVHLATDMEWFVAAAGTPDVSGTNYCNTGTAAAFNSGTANTQYCKSRYGAENMIGNVWEWTDAYWDFAPSPRTRSEFFGTTSVATTTLSDAVLGYTFPTSANPSVVSLWDFRFFIPKLTATTNPDFNGDGFWLTASAQRAAIRGGGWGDGAGAGRFALPLGYGPLDVGTYIGGRCALSGP